MTNYERYSKEINTNADYIIKKEDFIVWLKSIKAENEFKAILDKEDIYFVAVDYSIPVIMVKALKKEYNF